VFQSRDWVDVDSGALLALSHRSESDLGVSPTLVGKRVENRESVVKMRVFLPTFSYQRASPIWPDVLLDLLG